MKEIIISLNEECKLQGEVVKARGCDERINAFKGIPYAVPPVGKRRFMPPETSYLWSGIRLATEYGPICPQKIEETARIYFPYPIPENVSDDCLYLNVWTPNIDRAAKLPVMVWIHGGTLQTGFSNYFDGTAVAAKQNVVFVSINYRVGAFGYLCTGDDVVKGNMGLLDQIEALRWVQRHIVQFGGDPDNVTVFGESAGGISISHHIVSPLSRGVFRSSPDAASLFRRAICQSGVCLHPGSMVSPQQAKKFLHKRLPAMGCKSTNSKEILEFLQSLPASEIVKHLNLFSFVIKDDRYPDPHDAYKRDKINPVDLMVGFNSHEGMQFIASFANGHSVQSKQQALDITTRMVKVIVSLNQLLENLGKGTSDFGLSLHRMFYRGHPAADSIIRALCEEYLDGAGSDTLKLTQTLVEMYGDLLFVAPTIQNASYHSRYSNTYLYQCEYRMSLSTYPDWATADHGQEVPLMIGEPFLERFPDVWSNEDKQMSDTIMSLWANFARTGTPSCSGLPEWPLYEKSSRKYMNIAGNNSSKVMANYKPHRVRFWTEEMGSILNNRSPVHLSKY